MMIQIGQRPDHGFNEPLGLLSDCHRRIEHFLRTLIGIEQQTRGGALTPAQRDHLAGAIAYFATAAPRHTADEEQSLFPRLRASVDPGALRALETVTKLEADHQAAGARHQAVDVLGRRWLAEERLSAEDAAALREHLESLSTLYARHIGIEDRELFPAAARLLSAADIQAIGREMADRRLVPSSRARSPKPAAS